MPKTLYPQGHSPIPGSVPRSRPVKSVALELVPSTRVYLHLIVHLEQCFLYLSDEWASPTFLSHPDVVGSLIAALVLVWVLWKQTPRSGLNMWDLLGTGLKGVMGRESVKSGKRAWCGSHLCERKERSIKCSSADEWINRMWYIYTMEYFIW